VAPPASTAPPAGAIEAGPEQADADMPHPRAWTIRPGGRLGFTLDNGGMPIAGAFGRWSGDMLFDPEHPQAARPPPRRRRARPP
jgi:polyisoprenoid-binding protein YceI